jgi:hypothetical protein
MTLPFTPDDDRDLPLADDDIAVLRIYADTLAANAPVRAGTLSRAMATVVHLRRRVRELHAQNEAAWALLAADLTDTPPSSGIR